MKLFSHFLYSMSLISMFVANSTLTAHNFPAESDTEWGVRATHPKLDVGELKLPTAASDGKIPTLNQTGFMTPDKNRFTEEFARFCRKGSRVLDIGAAYGLATLPALNSEAQVIANDTDPRHLLLLREQVPEDQRSRLILNTQAFPEVTDFPDTSLDVIHICRVAHFFKSSQMDLALKKMWAWLKPGGRVYIITMSPYHHLFKGTFIETYEGRLSQGERWPGVIENMHDIASHLSDQIPPFLHVMDGRSLGTALKKVGFTIMKEKLFDYERKDAIKSDGKGYYGVCAEKTNTSPKREESTESWH